MLGIDPQKLRRWLREDRFEGVPGMTWIKNGFRDERRFGREWIVGAAAILEVEPNLPPEEVGEDG